MNEKLHDMLAQRRNAVNRFCRMADLEEKCVEEWLKDTTSRQKYSAWYRHVRWLVAALNEWRRVTSELIDAMEKSR